MKARAIRLSAREAGAPTGAACIARPRPYIGTMSTLASPATPIRIDVWSDFVCPYCFIGAMRLDQLAQKHAIDPVWHAFMLRPPGSPGMTAEKRAMIEAYTPRITAQIRDEFGLEMRRGPIGAQTFGAHHAMKHAGRHGKALAFNEAVLRAYWLDGEDIGDRDVLRRIGATLDLAFDDEVLDGRDMATAEAVRTDLAQAHAYELHGVPAFIFSNRYLVSGAQPPEVFERAARAAHESSVALH